jgi:hypothetical protein
MVNKKSFKTFLDYISKPLSQEKVNEIYRINNIKYERCELYSDFVQSLLLTIFETYLGDEITNEENQIKHFEWCWDNTIRIFEEENIYLGNDILYNYFLEFTHEVFYLYIDKTPHDYVDKSILKIWLELFNLNNQKTNSEIDTLIEIYNIFENSLIIN